LSSYDAISYYVTGVFSFDIFLSWTTLFSKYVLFI
jgi:hypothetical protein